MTENVSKPSAKMDSLLAHCLLRAVIAEEGGADAAAERYGPNAERLSKWQAMKQTVKVTPKASRVAGFVVTWAMAMGDEGRDGYSITEYQRYWNEGERQAYRLQKEFRELWPEFETPDELARQIVDHVDARGGRKDATTLPMTLQVIA